MADISKIITPDGTTYDIKDTTARSGLSGKQATITASGVLIGDGSGGVTAKTLDTSSLTNDNDHVPTSGVVKSAIDAKADQTDLASIHATGTSNATGATIPNKTYFYLNETLVRAKADIADGATFTDGTNYEAVTAGALNDLGILINGLDNRFPTVRATNLDSVRTQYGLSLNTGVYIVRFTSATANSPGASGICIGFEYTANSAVQLGIVSADNKIYVRYKSSGTWSSWRTI